MLKSPKNKPFLTIIILNYNSGDYLSKCLSSLDNCHHSTFDYQIIIVDNASSDDSFYKARQLNTKNCLFITSPTNNGFASGNNLGIKHLDPKTKYVLFLNPDTTVNPETLERMIDFFHSHKNVDAATCKIILAKTNQIQPECHRGFPTPWRSLCYFTGISKLFPKSQFFNGYFMGNLDLTKPQKIEACVGAFLMIKKQVGEKIKWWSTDYFFYGEDLDICFQLYQHHYQLWYNPYASIIHYQGISSGVQKYSKNRSGATKETKIQVALASTQAMRIFYQRNYFKHYPKFLQSLVNLGINILEKKRLAHARKSL